MKAEITPTENIQQLEENLEKRVKNIEKKQGKLGVELENVEKLSRIPGIDSYSFEGEERQGLKGRPVDEKVYARIESKRDAVRALLATIEGYNLIVLETDRQWDLKQLRKYNPEIIKLNSEEPEEELGVEKAITDEEGLEKVEIEMPEDDIETIYREMLT